MPEVENQLHAEYREFYNKRETERQSKVTVRSMQATDPVSVFIRRNFKDMSKTEQPPPRKLHGP